ncbi:MAG: tetratricopeptide repeat protein [Gammaproteobacteria bacterium]|nr:MAG: tetratricopeptide repeat protein [Gammaproteobacteria bacterium]
MISSMRISRSSSAVVSAWLIAACLSGCVVSRPEPTLPPGAPLPGETPPGETPPGSTQPAPGPGEAQPPPSERPPAQGPRQFRLGPAATALVTQAHAQAGSGEFGQAAVTLERALRIEPDNPLLWIELGRVRLGEGNAAQADAMGRKAVALATGDPSAQAAGWRLIADSLRGRGRDPEAAEAEQRAGALSPH